MIYLVPSPNRRAESVMRIVTTFLLFLLGLIGIAMLLQLAGCASYEGRLLKGGTKVFAAGCGTAETDFECLDQIGRVRELTEHAYEVKTGVTVPAWIWDHLLEVNIVLTPVSCPGMASNGTWNADSTCSGILVDHQDGGFHITIQNARCLAWTSLVHEYVHFIHRMVEGTADPEHTRWDLFYKPDSVQRRAEAAVEFEGFCDRALDLLNVGPSP